MNIREGQLAYFDVLNDRPQEVCRFKQGRFKAEVMLNARLKDRIFAIQLPLEGFPSSGVVFRRDLPGDPMIKFEKKRLEYEREID